MRKTLFVSFPSLFLFFPYSFRKKGSQGRAKVISQSGNKLKQEYFIPVMVEERGLGTIHWLSEAIIPEGHGLGEKSSIENQHPFWSEVFERKVARNTLQEVPLNVLGYSGFNGN
jgi:hypothetical protein